MDLATMMASKGDDAADPLLFNLVDLILACLRSHSPQTLLVTLQLVAVILKRHHRYAVITLLWTETAPGESMRRTTGAHQQEVDFLMSLAGTIGGQDNFDEIYDNVLKDTMVRLENHPCSLKLVTPKTASDNHKMAAIPDSIPGAPREVRPHTLRPDDPLLNIILDRLETFFVNPVEINLSLTEAIFDLAVCGFMRLEGWFLRDPKKYAYEETEATPASEPPEDPDSPEYAEFQQVQSMAHCRRRPRWTKDSIPRFLAILQTLCQEIDAYRDTVPRFDNLLQQRREAFHIADSDISKQMPRRPTISALQPDSSPNGEPTGNGEARSASKERPSGLEGFAQRILSELGTPSRSGSPRGLRDVARALSERSSPAPSPASNASYEAPLRPSPTPLGGTRPFSPGSRSPAVAGSWTGSRSDVVTSQMKAFQAIDQSILARKVRVPPLKKDPTDPIPLSFEKKPTIEVVMGGEESEPRPVTEGEHGKDESAWRSEAGLTEKTLGQQSKVDEDDAEAISEEQTASVSHVLTNTIILQSFLFELASLVQVRAGLFDEIRFV